MNFFDKAASLRSEWCRLSRDHAPALDGWTFTFDRARKRYGVCRYGPKIVSLSKALVRLNPLEESLETLRHEVAHVLSGPEAGHGPRWREAARLLGARPERCYDSQSVEVPLARYRVECPGCGFSIRRHRLSARLGHLACRRCCNQHEGGAYSARFQLRITDTWQERPIEADELPAPARRRRAGRR